jgi:hypothetical protein
MSHCMSRRLSLEYESISQKHHSDIRSINHVFQSRFLRSLICRIDQASRHFFEQHSQDSKIALWRAQSRQLMVRYLSLSSRQQARDNLINLRFLSSSYKSENRFMIWSSNKSEKRSLSYRYNHCRYIDWWHSDSDRREFCYCERKSNRWR